MAGDIAEAVNDEKNNNNRREAEARIHSKEVENLLKATRALKISGKGFSQEK